MPRYIFLGAEVACCMAPGQQGDKPHLDGEQQGVGLEQALHQQLLHTQHFTPSRQRLLPQKLCRQGPRRLLALHRRFLHPHEPSSLLDGVSTLCDLVQFDTAGMR